MPAERAQLAQRLREVRAAAYSSGSKFAEAAGWPQSRVSKIERGAQMPTEDDITQWVQTVGADEETQRELLSRLAAARVEYATHKEIARADGGLASQQAAYGEAERAASRIVEYRPAMLPGLVQTPAYGREIMGLSFTARDEEEIERVVGARMQRQSVIYEPGKRIEIVIGEAALRTAPGTIETLVEQLDRLTTVAGLTSVQMGILPFPVMPIMPLSGFSLRDRVASVETVTGEQMLHHPTEVDTYEEAFARAMSAAVTGRDAVTLIRRVTDELRASQ